MANNSVPNSGLWSSIAAIINSCFAALTFNNRVMVRSITDLTGTLSSTKEYFLDGQIDTGTTTIQVPAGGLNLSGYNFNVSGLFSTANNYTMFNSPVGGSGDLLGKDYSVSASGTNSQVYDITDSTGLHAFEFARINYNDCTSLGTIADYRQGLEVGTGRFGGTPELTLEGTWLGGYFIDTSIVRSLDDGAYSLFKAGTGFSMVSRFRSNQNIDLPASANFFDFSASNFVNPSTVLLEGVILTRDGVFDATDSNITPNITASELVCSWSDNNGLSNTFVGAEANVTAESTTAIASSGVFVGTFTAADLQHFDSPANGQLRHLGSSPREFAVTGQLVIDSSSNNEVDLKIVVFRADSTTFEDQKTQRRVINNLQGGRDVAYFGLSDNIILNQNDYVKLQVANVNATNNITAELDSFMMVGAR